MPNVNRWSLAQNQSPDPNPGAGLGVGRAQTPRSDAAVAKNAGGGGASPRDWQPTVLNLAILIVLELLAFAGLRYAFRSAHGG